MYCSMVKGARSWLCLACVRPWVQIPASEINSHPTENPTWNHLRRTVEGRLQPDTLSRLRPTPQVGTVASLSTHPCGYGHSQAELSQSNLLAFTLHPAVRHKLALVLSLRHSTCLCMCPLSPGTAPSDIPSSLPLPFPNAQG